MGGVGLLGLALAALSYRVAFPASTRPRIDIFIAAYTLHVACALAYWWVSLDAGFDAFFYYDDSARWVGRPFEPGTIFVIQFVQAMKRALAGSFLDYFLFFQAFGMFGIALLLRSFHEVADSLNIEVPAIVYGLAFLPGPHFWSVAIGKDAPLFMAVALSIWAVMRPRSRIGWLLLAIAVMALIRTHVAALACLSIGAALLFDRNLPLLAKLVLAVAAVAGFAYVAGSVQAQLGLDTLDPNSVSDFIESTQEVGRQYGGGAELGQLPFLLQLLSLLFRPFFFDASGALGFIASVENLILAGILGSLVINAKLLVRLSRTVFHMAYCMVFSAALIILLALVNYNVGLGLRQKMMAMPAIALLFASLTLYKRYRDARARRSAVGALASPSDA